MWEQAISLIYCMSSYLISPRLYCIRRRCCLFCVCRHLHLVCWLPGLCLALLQQWAIFASAQWHPCYLALNIKALSRLRAWLVWMCVCVCARVCVCVCVCICVCACVAHLFLLLATILGSALGPLLFALCYDMTDSFVLVFTACIPLTLISAVISAQLKPRGLRKIANVRLI